MKTRALSSRFITGSIAAAIAFAAPASLAIAGFEAATPAAYAQTALPGNIDTSRTVDLTVHKYLGDPSGTAGDGSNITAPAGATALSGVQFKVTPITGISPQNADGWAKFSKLKISAGGAGVDFGDTGASLDDAASKTMTTGGDGTAKFAGMDQGFYLITEIPDASNPGRVIASPFLAALPMTTPTKDAWNYDVHVHPKNQQLSVTKTVDDGAVTKGAADALKYSINGQVPSPITTGGSFNRYVLIDDYAEGIVTPNMDSLKVSITGGSAADLVKDTDYTATDDGKEIKVALTQAGLTKLADAKKADTATTLKMDFSATLTGDLPTDGNVPNEPLFLPPQNPNVEVNNTPIPGTSVKTEMINIKVQKQNGSGAALEGAVFELHRYNAGAGNVLDEKTVSAEGDAKLVDSTKISVDGKDSWTSDAQGVIAINGIQVNDFADNANVDNPDWEYALVEVKAPNGYELNPKPIRIGSTLEQAALNGTANTVEVTIDNFPSNGGFELPVTGAQGVMWMALGAITIAGATYLVMGRRREEA